MAHRFNVVHYACAIGRAEDTRAALLIRDLSIPTPIASIDNGLDQKLASVEVAPLVPQQPTVAKQLCALLERLLVQLPLPILDQPVFLLLPEGMDSGDDMMALSREIQQQAPGLLHHPESRVFAYGACSPLLALRAVENLWQKDGRCKPWMIALDSPLGLGNLSFTGAARLESVACLSEGAVAVQWEADVGGLRCRFNETELQQSGSAGPPALEAVLRRLSQFLEEPISTVYLPDNGSVSMSDNWLQSCNQLHPWITGKTEYEFLAYHSGDIGSSGGLYRLLHLYLAHQSLARSGVTLQCEQGESGFCSAAAFDWQPAESE